MGAPNIDIIIGVCHRSKSELMMIFSAESEKFSKESI